MPAQTKKEGALSALAEPIQIEARNDQEIEQASRLYRALLHERKAALVSPGGDPIESPLSLHDVLLRVVEKLQEGRRLL